MNALFVQPNKLMGVCVFFFNVPGPGCLIVGYASGVCFEVEHPNST